YTRLADHENATAAFKRAIDDEPRYLATTPESGDDTQVQLAAIRSELQAMERRWSFTLANNTCLVDDGCRIDNAAIDNGSTGLAFGSMVVGYQPPKIDCQNGRIFQLFSRLFWSYEPDALSFDLN